MGSLDQHIFMTEFSRALTCYRNGAWSRERLLAELDSQIRDERTDAVVLLGILSDEHFRAPLPDDVHRELERKLLRWAGPRTVVRIPAKDVEGTWSSERGEPATVVMDSGEGPADTASAPPAPPPVEIVAVDDVLQGRFRLVERIGEGGMSRVFKAIDLRKVEARSADPYVAVKVLTVPFRDPSRALALLQREAQRVQSLAHPNIVRVNDCDRDGRVVFMTMEYLAGQSLRQKLLAPAVHGLPANEALEVIDRIASALTVAHYNGILHGDLKPGNVIVSEAGEVKVIDFGIARVLARSQEGESPSRAAAAEDGLPEIVAFTPAYASPEMLEGREPDIRDDVYAFACIVYETLTGEHPFRHRTAAAAREMGIEPPRPEHVSRRQFKAILHGLAFEREARTPSIEQFLKEFYGSSGASLQWGVVVGGVAIAAVFATLYATGGLYRNQPAAVVKPATDTAPLEAGDVFRDCATCPLMKVLPAGRFQQGAAPGEADANPFERPQHAVAIQRPVGMAVYEVSVVEFREFAQASGYTAPGCASYDGTWQQQDDLNWQRPGYAQMASHPVTCISWRDANAYTEWLSRRTKQNYRLPTASEWEYAARAGTQSPRPWTDEDGKACAAANVADQTTVRRYPGWKVQSCTDSFVYTAPIGSFAANAFGLHDMLGNVFEWVQDCWHDSYSRAPTDGSAWLEEGCVQRELRGGSWFTSPSYVRTAYRNRFEETYRSNSVGFRVVRTVP